jgi:hypothetical protein
VYLRHLLRQLDRSDDPAIVLGAQVVVQLLLGVPFLPQDEGPGLLDVGEQVTRPAAGLDPAPPDQRGEGPDERTATLISGKPLPFLREQSPAACREGPRGRSGSAALGADGPGGGRTRLEVSGRLWGEKSS